MDLKHIKTMIKQKHSRSRLLTRQSDYKFGRGYNTKNSLLLEYKILNKFSNKNNYLLEYYNVTH